jgi:uncharacterized protein involved in exopolysaccharide biosynthesis
MQLESLDRLELDLRDTQRQYASTQAELRALDVSLESAKAGIGVNAGLEQGGAAANTSGVTELAKLKAELDKLNGVYSDDHPTVRALKRRIETLEKSEAGKASGTGDKPVTAQSVMVAKVQAQIDSANARLSLLERQENTIRNKMSQIEGRVVQSAQTEGELGTLTRDYDNAKAAYAELKTKQDNAKIANNIEMENKGERFVISEAPILPTAPIKPNRKMLVIAGLFAAIFASIGSAILLEMFDGRIRGVDALAAIMKMQPIATIPYISNPREEAEKKRLLISKLVGAVIAIIVLLAIVHLFVTPLGTLISNVMAKF